MRLFEAIRMVVSECKSLPDEEGKNHGRGWKERGDGYCNKLRGGDTYQLVHDHALLLVVDRGQK